MPRLLVEFRVRGVAKSQGSKTAGLGRRKSDGSAYGYVREANPKGLSDWRRDVKAAAVVAWPMSRPPVEGPVAVTLTFVFSRPPSHSAKQRRLPWHTNVPDAEKLARATNDALKMVIWRDDKQVVDLRVLKVWDNASKGLAPGVWVRICELSPEDVATALAAATAVETVEQWLESRGTGDVQ